jgi:hypothetical protein
MVLDLRTSAFLKSSAVELYIVAFAKFIALNNIFVRNLLAIFATNPGITNG